MGRFIQFFKMNTLLMVFSIAIIPVLLLLGLQYVWLDRLERASAVAQQAALKNYLEAVATEVEFFYRSSAERLLNVPSESFYKKDFEKVVGHWRKKPIRGIRRLFLVNYTAVPTGNFYTYDPQEMSLKSTHSSDESLAVVIACLPWQNLVHAQEIAETVSLHVNERDPNHRIVLKPVTDDQMKIVGVAAMILDEEYFRENLLKTTVKKALPAFFPNEERENLWLTVRDHEQNLILGKVIDNDSKPAVTLKFPFVFSDWTLGLHSIGPTPQQWARRSFTFNMTLAVLIAVVLLCGILLALRTANRAVKLSKMKSHFVSNVSHELRTPLASIRVFAEHLSLGRVTSEQKVKEYGKYIELESRRLTRLIDNLLDFSRIESERKIYQFEPTDLGAIVESVMKSFTPRFKQSGFNASVNLPEYSLPQVGADPDAISQALHNLLDNAIKYSPETKNIIVSLLTEDDAIVISVKDCGIGINKEEQAKVFNRFHRVNTSLVHDIGGNGLGLSIVQHVIRAHGGTVTVKSDLGEGSTFSIRIPIKNKSTANRLKSRDSFV
ncbi:MAG: HAMP domain-containing histidine kinase [Proteobacteria bacterium]|nr:HAMP domain-containing histidine kinase [Pseudomonadota bacterium]